MQELQTVLGQRYRKRYIWKTLRTTHGADTIKRRVIPGRPILDQVISANKRDGGMKVRAPDSGLKLRHGGLTPEASGTKLQATSKPEPVQVQQASSAKRQASQSE